MKGAQLKAAEMVQLHGIINDAGRRASIDVL